VDHANGDLGLDTHYMGPTKGSHLVVDNPALAAELDGQMVYYQHADGRVCIVFPFLGKVIMGSTDIRVDDPDTARCEPAEVEYMLQTLRGVLPNIEIRRDQIVHVFCGCRPLPASGSKVTAVVSRGHTIFADEPDAARPWPVLSLVGGKWTTFRALAQEAADDVLTRLGETRKAGTAELPIGGGCGCPAGEAEREKWIARVAGQTGLPETRIADLLGRYGTKAESYAQAEAGDAAAAAPLASLPDYSAGEIRRIAAEEYVRRLDDLVCRRSTIALLGRAGKPALTEIAAIAGEVLNWDAARQAEEVARAAEELRMPQEQG